MLKNIITQKAWLKEATSAVWGDGHIVQDLTVALDSHTWWSLWEVQD